MHTPTNYYLFSLAISDLLLLLSGVPQEMYFIWSKYPYIFGEIFCVGRGVLAETSANATVLIVTAFTVERYVAICHPFRSQAMTELNRALRIIVIIWILSLITAIPQAAQFGIISWYGGIEQCVVVRNVIRHSFQLSTLVFFFAPMTIILVLYSLIGIRLHRSKVISSSRQVRVGVSVQISEHNDSIMYRRHIGGIQINPLQQDRCMNHKQNSKRVLKMLVAVVIAFFLCWAPFHAQRLIAVYATGEDHFDIRKTKRNHHEFIYTVMTYISGVLYYLSTCINPLLYNIMSKKFRQAFKAIIFRNNRSIHLINLKRQQESNRIRRNRILKASAQKNI